MHYSANRYTRGIYDVTMPADHALLDSIRAHLRAAADPTRAPAAQRYMKSTMPYLGVRVPQVRAIVRTALRETGLPDTRTLTDTVRALWSHAQAREERYAALAVLAAPATRALRTPELIGLYAELIVDGAWWDLVDDLAHRVGELLVQFPAQTKPVVRGWQLEQDVWLRRVSIICQVGLKEQVDEDLLSRAIEANAQDRDFFIRKAIGWALRDHARVAPEWVRAFVDTHDLAPLSVREATKRL
jgi:3-methyladenine DNA glycosylase AlkD